MRKVIIGAPALIAVALAVWFTGGAVAEHRAADGCSTAVASAQPVAARTAFVSLPASPFGIAVTPDSRWSFVAESGGHVVGARERWISPTSGPNRSGCRRMRSASRVAGTVARPGSHRTVRALFAHGSSGQRVINPAVGRSSTSKSSP